MAEPLTPNAEDVTKEKQESQVHNIADLNKLIRNCANEMRDIKKQRQELNEIAKDIRKRLRDAGVTVAAFDYALRVADMEAEPRQEYVDQLRVNFEALGIGQQSDMFEAPEGNAPQVSAANTDMI